MTVKKDINVDALCSTHHIIWHMKLWNFWATNWQLCLYLFICMQRWNLFHSNYSGQFLTFIQIVILYTIFLSTIFCYCLHTFYICTNGIYIWNRVASVWLAHHSKKDRMHIIHIYLWYELALGCIHFKAIKPKCEQKLPHAVSPLVHHHFQMILSICATCITWIGYMANMVCKLYRQ